MKNISINITITLILGFMMAFFSQVTFAKECRIEGYPYAIDCYEITSQEKKGFVLKVFKVASTVRYPRTEPIIWIPDGLTINPVERAPSMIVTLSRIRAQRDFMWLAFEHPDKLSLKKCNPDAESPQLQVADIQHRMESFYSDEKLTNCIDKISQLNDQTIFSYQNIARLYEEIRQKLGLKQVIVVSEGRGAEIAQNWHQIAPDAIRYAVMDSPVFNKIDYKIEQAISQENALKAVFKTCNHSKQCIQAYPDTQQDFIKITESLPQTITVNDPLTLQKTTFIMDEVLFLQAMQFFLRTSGRAKSLPMLLASARNGDWQPMIGLLSINWYKKTNRANLGVFLLESCKYFDPNETQHAQGLNNIARWFFNAGQKRLERSCDQISADSKIQSVFTPPSLVLVGGVNPSRQSFQGFFKHATVIDAKNAGANLLGYGCTKDVVYRFIKALDAAQNPSFLPNVKSLEADCITQVPYPSVDNLVFFPRGAR